MNPDVAAAVAEMEADGTITGEQSHLLGRVARRELASVHAELRLLSYAGVLLLMAGVGLLVRENLEHIGPTAIASALALAAAVCLAWVHREAPAFSAGEAISPHPAFDYVLLLGALLVGADLAYIEVMFAALGEAWAYHLLLASVLYLALAFRYDSRVVLSLALSTFAAWRGLSAAKLGHAVFGSADDVVRVNAALCAVAFLGLGAVLHRQGWKAHFEPVTTQLGWIILLAAAFSGLGSGDGRTPVFATLLLIAGALAAAVALRLGRFALLALGVVAAYVGVSVLVVDAVDNEFFSFLWFAFTPFVMVVVLLLLHRRLREPR